jgi:ribosomal-protein-alanine N-acetyltransferase
MAMSARRPELRTARLLLRRWREPDLAPFAAMNADPEVMEHYPARLTRAESDAFARRIEEGFREDGFGLWAIETLADGSFIGYTGLARPAFTAHFTSPARPATEIGWRLARHAWGHGYATEAAHAVLGFAFGQAGLHEIVSFTAETNTRSQAVMRRIGMIRHPADDFDHPALPPGHPLRRHVLYRITQPDWHTVPGDMLARYGSAGEDAALDW